jgi:hypothetical protein
VEGIEREELLGCPRWTADRLNSVVTGICGAGRRGSAGSPSINSKSNHDPRWESPRRKRSLPELSFAQSCSKNTPGGGATRNDHSLSAVDDERAVVRHQRISPM